MKPYAYKQYEDPFGSECVPIEECASDLIAVARLSFYTEP